MTLTFCSAFLTIAFDVLMVRGGNKKPNQNVSSKRQKGGHGSTLSAICVTCYNLKRRCTLGRFNESSIKRHSQSVHQVGEKIDVISVEDPRAFSILKELKSAASKM